jgi:hypothetical protein
VRENKRREESGRSYNRRDVRNRADRTMSILSEAALRMNVCGLDNRKGSDYHDSEKCRQFAEALPVEMW